MYGWWFPDVLQLCAAIKDDIWGGGLQRKQLKDTQRVCEAHKSSLIAVRQIPKPLHVKAPQTDVHYTKGLILCGFIQ